MNKVQCLTCGVTGENYKVDCDCSAEETRVATYGNRYRPTWDDYFFEIARAVAIRSTCLRKRVGAVLVENQFHTILGVGYNGSPPGEPHCIDVGCDIVDGHCKRTIHAEINAMKYVFHFMPISVNETEPTYTLYCTLGVCSDCEEYARNFTGLNDRIEFKYLEEYK